MIAAVVLSGGRSERMGSPKALLQAADGLTLLERLTRLVSTCGFDETIVVTGHHDREIRQATTLAPAWRWVYNDRHHEGMTTSFQAGLRSLSDEVEAAMIFLVDQPGVTVNVIRRLIESGADGEFVVPSVRGRRGHPLLIRRAGFARVLELPPSCGVNTLFRSHPERVAHVVFDDDKILADMDTPEDFERWRSRSEIS